MDDFYVFRSCVRWNEYIPIYLVNEYILTAEYICTHLLSKWVYTHSIGNVAIVIANSKLKDLFNILSTG